MAHLNLHSLVHIKCTTYLNKVSSSALNFTLTVIWCYCLNKEHNIGAVESALAQVATDPLSSSGLATY